jgi:uncharacterized YigZ family protein
MEGPNDTYLTLNKVTEGLYKEKGSKFIAFAYPVYSEDDIKEALAEVRKSHHSARHHCYAWRLGHEKKHYRANDDGEPSNSAGKPILGQVQSFDLTNVLIVVVRYFGGIKLGVGGLITAYREAAKDAIGENKIIERIVHEHHRINFEYAQMSDVMGIVKAEQLKQLKQNFALNCALDVAVRLKKADTVIDQLNKIEGVKTDLLGLF